jgi:hypothetical protein
MLPNMDVMKRLGVVMGRRQKYFRDLLIACVYLYTSAFVVNLVLQYPSWNSGRQNVLYKLIFNLRSCSSLMGVRDAV